ncbi:Predicted membrane protein%2C putative toxin regulator [uncultured Clostridium sp.]|uniref:PTS transporter subunit IIC n=1 Tax=uncultured Clostridium sp. TaxID=59620 RepID=UPI000822CE67|nr:PTS sugar transporter subunit IIC [uncultured Clostridium sp.]SCJ99760.1 Predicted membrane protein%2C putative toxin regulator [uncultured Clostridium sp.]
MKFIKKYLNHIFIDGLSGMALGLFSTLIIGTILQQIGKLIGGDIGNLIFIIGKVAAACTSAGIGVGVAYKYKALPLVVVSAAVSGVIGGYATKILAGSIMTDTGAIMLAGPGEPLGAFIASFVAIEIGNLISDKTKVDIILTPLISIGFGSSIGLIVGPPISKFMASLGNIIIFSTEQQPFIMGILVAVIMGMLLTLPISSAAIGVILDLNGITAGAAVVGCCCQMVGFAVASYRENKFGGLLAQGSGTSMLQIPNIFRKPIIWLPSILSSAILGPISTTVLKMTNNATGSGMGSAGFVGQIMAYETMVQTTTPSIVIIEIVLMHFILPAIITILISEYMRKKGLIKFGDMSLKL